MKVICPVVIRGTGAFVPETVVTNAEFATYLDTSDEWITQRTGIKRRHKAAENESTKRRFISRCMRSISRQGDVYPYRLNGRLNGNLLILFIAKTSCTYKLE